MVAWRMTDQLASSARIDGYARFESDSLIETFDLPEQQVDTEHTEANVLLKGMTELAQLQSELPKLISLLQSRFG